MIYNLSLQTAGLAAGLLLIFTHAFALFRPEQTVAWAKAFPRSRGAATALLAIAAGFTEAVGGAFDLEDTPGGGLTAVFRFPIAAAIDPWSSHA